MMKEGEHGAVRLDERHRRKLEVQLKAWQDDLVNLTKRNRLLYFRHTKTSTLELVAPDLETVWRGLDGGWKFHLPPEPAGTDGAETSHDDGADDDTETPSVNLELWAPPDASSVVGDAVPLCPGFDGKISESDEEVFEAADDELVVKGKDTDSIQKSLRAVERTTNQTHLDTGVWILYLAFGMLRWSEPGEDTPFESPRFLQPIAFDGRTSLNKPFRLTLG